MNYRLNEVKLAIQDSSKYFLSHHLEEENYRCYNLEFLFSRKIYLCARCLGIYNGILFGIGLFFWGILPDYFEYLAISVFPLFTILDWVITQFTSRRGKNTIRTFCGFLLGLAYGLGLSNLFSSFPNYFVILLGIVYASLAFILLLIKERSRTLKAENSVLVK